MRDLSKLLPLLQGPAPVLIQTHNFPDHDSIAAAFALQVLLGKLGTTAGIVYDRDIQRDSLRRMITDLGIEAQRASDLGDLPHARIVIVDGCKGNANVTDLPGEEVGVIDHHRVVAPEAVPFVDIRPDYGACSTMVGEYYRAHNVPIPPRVATALMVGISMDTSRLTRGMNARDLEIYFHCFGLADLPYVTSLLRNSMHLPDLHRFQHLLDTLVMNETAAVAHFPDGCHQNVLGLLGDFLLGFDEIDFVLLSARNGGLVNLSLRSERHEWDASRLVRAVVEGRGFGGGHAEMAGGAITEVTAFAPATLWTQLATHLGLSAPDAWHPVSAAREHSA
jgi:nanoRNase/pAp phosphatase (c-di-AMP/oligoRNAs hydrolase)